MPRQPLNATISILAPDVLPPAGTQSPYGPNMAPAPLPQTPSAANMFQAKKGGKVKAKKKKMAMGGNVRGGGIERKGKTRGRFV